MTEPKMLTKNEIGHIGKAHEQCSDEFGCVVKKLLSHIAALEAQIDEIRRMAGRDRLTEDLKTLKAFMLKHALECAVSPRSDCDVCHQAYLRLLHSEDSRKEPHGRSDT